jgi:4'-phosphopantetheinyl transferase
MHQWLSPPAACPLPPGSLHIWRTHLDFSADSLSRYSEVLTDDERSRANRFVSSRERDRYTVSRATLRLLLGRYLQIPPDSVRIGEGPRGKPFVEGNKLESELKFNLSHSQELVVYAFARQREVGIDVEKIRTDFASREVAQRYFSSQEIGELDALAPELYPAGFFRCWVRKEAYMKAHGLGFQMALDSFSVSLAQEHAPRLTASDSERWSMYSFEPFPEYTSAVFAEKYDWTLSFYECSGLF